MSVTNTINGGVRQWKRYSHHEPSEVEWLRDIPRGWETMQFKRIARIRYGLGQPPPESPDGVPLIRATNIAHGVITDAGMMLIDSRQVPPGKSAVLSTNEIVVVRSGAYTGDSAIVPQRYAGSIAGYDMVATIKRGIEAFFAWQLLSREIYDLQFGFVKLRAAQPHLNSEELGKTVVTVPPLDEQRCIVAFLERETAKIDALIAKKERLIELLQEKRTSLISHAVTKGLDPNVPMKDSGIEWAAQIPTTWEVRRNILVFSERDQRAYPDLPILEVSLRTGVTERQFSDQHIEQQAADPSSYKRAAKGDLVFNKMRMWQGAVGVAPVDGLVSPDYTVANPREGNDSKYFEYLFRTSYYMTEVNRFSHGIVRDRNRLYWDQFKEMPSLVPPTHEQQAILRHIAKVGSHIDRLIAKVREAIDKLREYRTALISAAVTGKIDVRGEIA